MSESEAEVEGLKHLTAAEVKQLEACIETKGGQFKLALTRPVEVGKTTYTELTFRAMTGRDLRNLPVGGTAKLGDYVAIAAGMATEPAAVFDALTPKDTSRVIEVVGFFVGHS